MIDANDYADPLGGLPPAERVLLPQWWTAEVPLDKALKAPMGPSSTAVNAVVSHKRWVVACPDCMGAQLTAPQDRRFMCVDCGNVAVGGKWRPVLWPKEFAEIGSLLDGRAPNVAHWSPGETLADLRQENKMLAEAHQIGRA